jgi:hypothetical protein
MYKVKNPNPMIIIESRTEGDVNPVKNNETQQRNGTQDRSMDRFE